MDRQLRSAGLALAVDVLAAYRLTRLVREDEITAGLRERVEHAAFRQIDSPGVAAKARTLIECPWCVGFWISTGVVVARTVAPKTWNKVAGVLAISAAVGIISENA